MKTLLLLLSAALAQAQYIPPSGGGGGSAPVGGLGAVQLYATSSAQAGDNAALYGNTTAIVPGAPTVTVQGATGASTWSYAVSACNVLGCSTVGANGTVANGFAALDGAHFNRVVTPSVSGSTICNIYITAAPVGGSVGLIDSGNACGATFYDQSGHGEGAPSSTDLTTGIYVAGSVNARTRGAFGAGSSLGNSFAAILDVEGTAIDPPNDFGLIGAALNLSLTAIPGSPTPGDAFAANVQIVVDSSSTNPLRVIKALVGFADNQGAGNIDAIYGLDFLVGHSGAGDVEDLYASSVDVSHSGAGAVDDMIGYLTIIENDGGLVNDAANFYARTPIGMSLANITNLYGLRIEDQAGATNNWAIKTGLGKVEFGDKIVYTGAPTSCSGQPTGTIAVVATVFTSCP